MEQDLSLGQHFMIDETILTFITQQAAINRFDEVLEVGSGQGALTKHLHRAHPKKLICVEQDKRFSAPSQAKLVRGNILSVIDELSFNKVVANIPYHISEPLFIKFLLHQPSTIVVVTGDTFAEKLLGDTILGLIFRSLYAVEKIMTIHPEAFSPPPKTVSALLLARLSPQPLASLLLPFYTHQRQKVKNYILLVTQDFWTKKEAKQHSVVLQSLLEKKLYTLRTQEFILLYEFLSQSVATHGKNI